MGGTKIVVLQLRQIIRTLIFVLVGVVIIGLLIYFLIPKSGSSSTGDESALYVPGTYSALVTLKNDSINVTVTVDKNEILAVSLGDMLSSQETFYPLIKPAMESISKEIIDSQTANVAIAEDYRQTGTLLLQAVRTALAQAETGSEG